MASRKITIKVHSNRSLVESEFSSAVNSMLNELGEAATKHAKDNCPVDTGYMKRQLKHKRQDENSEIVGTANVDYSVYVELGTGIYAENGNGRKTPWRYQDKNGEWHTTRGQRPQPFIRPAIENHLNEYKKIIERGMKGKSRNQKGNANTIK